MHFKVKITAHIYRSPCPLKFQVNVCGALILVVMRTCNLPRRLWRIVLVCEAIFFVRALRNRTIGLGLYFSFHIFCLLYNVKLEVGEIEKDSCVLTPNNLSCIIFENYLSDIETK